MKPNTFHLTLPSLRVRSLFSDTKLVLLLVILGGIFRSYAQTVPIDPDVGCPVPSPTVAGWFKSGTITVNGAVNPANSVSFPNSPNCSFYEWSYQMFLWLTSPTPAIYGAGGAHIFESSAFFDVSPPDANGRRTFVPHKVGFVPVFDLFKRQVGPNRLPLIFDKQGRMFEVKPPPKQIPPLRIRSTAGQLIEISRVQLEDGGKKVFLDKAGKVVAPRFFSKAPEPALNLRERQAVPQTVPQIQKFILNRIPIFLDPSGNVIDVEQGQADGSVLIAQNGSPIFYGLAVNEVFAYFRTMQGATVSSSLLFPTRQDDLDAITTFANAHGKTFVDAEALAIEVKTSWIEAAGISNPNDYITMTATIPDYDKSDPNKWVPKPQNKTAKLAMVGMHVVGSTKGHPEMIWATFEHIGNTPNDEYTYRNGGGGNTLKGRDTSSPSGSWLFCANNSSGPFNQARNMFDGTNIIAVSSSPVGPDNILRMKAWGAAFDLSPNFKTPQASNSEIISINNSVRGVLASGDVRGNYIMTGSTWMIAGTFPFATFNTTQVGTSKLNNSTMETFTQGPDNKALTASGTSNGTFNCFTCHSGGQPKTTVVSHIFADLKPLF